MIDSDLLQSNYLGRDGFRWWIGQVANPQTSGWGQAKEVNAKQQVPDDVDVDGEMYLRRCKVRILGYHTISDSQGYVLKDTDLPWAHVMVPAGQGTGVNGVGEFHEYRGGENVLGFFLDGDDAQQPVIIGGFGNQPPTEKNEKTKESEITNETNCEIKPFQPRLSKKQDIKFLHLVKQKITAPSTGDTTNALTGITEGADTETPVDFTIRENVGSGSRDSPGGNKAASKIERDIVVTREVKTDKDNLVGKVHSILEGLQKTLKSIEKYNDVYIGNTIHTVRSLRAQVDGYTKKIAGYIRNFLERFKSQLFKIFEEGINAAFAFIGETFKPPILAGVMAGIEFIMCEIKAIIGELGIFNVVQEQIEAIIEGNYIDSLICAAEELIINILNTFLGPIFEAISGALDLLENFLVGISNAANRAIGQVSEFLNRILAFFSCFGFETSSDASWSLSGPSKTEEQSFINVLSGLDIPDIPLPDSLKDVPPSPLACDAYNGYLFPPIVEFSFGDASATAVVGGDEVIGIYIDEPGRGYSPLFPPAISIIQPGVWGTGGGAKATAVVDPETGGISRAILRKSGRKYVSTPTLAASSVTAPDSIIDDEIPRNKISNVENVIPIFNDLDIIDPGFGYTQDGTTILIDDENIEDLGFEVSLEIGPEGSIIEININNTNNFPLTVTKRPTIEIVSDTGSNAVIVPNIDFILVRDFTRNAQALGVDGLDGLDDELVTVDDINGNTITVKSSEVLQVVQCYN